MKDQELIDAIKSSRLSKNYKKELIKRVKSGNGLDVLKWFIRIYLAIDKIGDIDIDTFL